MPDPRADPHLAHSLGMHRIYVHVPCALFALVKQGVALTACKVLGEVFHGLPLARMAALNCSA